MTTERIKVLGVSRSARFSPNSTGRDEAIFMAVASRLQRMGYDVSTISEDFLIGVEWEKFRLVFSMARSAESLRELAEAERAHGIIVVNSPSALLRATRAAVMQAIAAKGDLAPQPRFAVCSVAPSTIEKVAAAGIRFPLWLKRSDTCAQSKDDVLYAGNEDELAETVATFASHKISECVAVEHAEGDLVKFYGVSHSDFFHTCYPTDAGGYSKFGLESHNGEARHYAFDEGRLHAAAETAAEATGIQVYGGDAIVRADGTFVIIDFNDWPSFSPCRKEAAKAIARSLDAAAKGGN